MVTTSKKNTIILKNTISPRQKRILQFLFLLVETTIEITKNPILHQGRSGIKIPRLDMCRFIIILSIIAHQMWRDHSFSERNKTTEKAVGVEIERGRVGGRRLDKI